MSICWAYDKQMRRCTLEAGHEKDHAIYITWTDDECFSPEDPVQNVVHIPVRIPAEEPSIKMEMEYDPEPIQPKKPDTCVACQHNHVGGECKCGCYAHI